MPTVYTVEQVLADPIQLNSRLGTYTNFVNLLDLCGLAVPASMRADGMPFGVTLLAPGGSDALLASLGRVFHADTGLPLGATGQRAAAARAVVRRACAGRDRARGGRRASLRHAAQRRADSRSARASSKRRRPRRTTGCSRSNGRPPAQPGMLRVADGEGAAIALEVWALPADGFGRFVAAIPPPLSIGTLTLADGRTRERLSGRGRRRSTARAIFRASAAGAPSWRRAKSR